MINKQLKEDLNRRISDGEFAAADLPAFFTLFCQIGDENEEIQEEVEGWCQRIQLDLPGLDLYWITVEDGRFTTAQGAIERPDLIFTMGAAEAAQIFIGDLDAESAFVSGALKVQGDLPDALKLQTLIEIVADEIEY